MQLVGAVAYGRQTVHDILELGKDILVDVFTGDELAVVKTDAVVK